MARPKKEGLDYFPHDTDACTDEKVEALMMLYGTKGYAFYFILLERIYRTADCELDVSDAETRQILGKKIGINAEEFDLILKSAIKHKCFDKEKYENSNILTSNGIKSRANVVIEKRLKMREKYVSKDEIVSDAETREETKKEPDKVKESKVKKIKEIKEKCEDFSQIIDSYTKSDNLITAINEFMQYRKEIKKPVASSMTLNKIIGVLKKHPEAIQIEMMNQSIANGWQGIFEISNNKKAQSQYKARTDVKEDTRVHTRRDDY